MVSPNDAASMAAWRSVYMQPLAQTVRVAASARDAISDRDNRKQTHAPVLTRLINGQPLVCDEAVRQSKGPATFEFRGQTGRDLRTSSGQRAAGVLARYSAIWRKEAAAAICGVYRCVTRTAI